MNNEFGFDSNRLDIYFKDNIKLGNKKFNIEVRSDFYEYPVMHVYSTKLDHLIRLDTLEYINDNRLTDRQEKILMKYLSEPDPHYPIDNRVISAISEWNFAYKNSYGINYKYDINNILSINENSHIK